MARSFTEPIDKQNADAVMNISINANKEVYNKIREENPFMCQALRELMKEEMEEEIQTAVKEAETRAAQEATKKATDATIIASIKSLMQKLGMDAKVAMETLGISAADQRRYMTML